MQKYEIFWNLCIENNCFLPFTIYSGSRKSCQILIENLSTILKTIKSGFITQIEHKNEGAQSGCCTKHYNEGCM